MTTIANPTSSVVFKSHKVYLYFILSQATILTMRGKCEFQEFMHTIYYLKSADFASCVSAS